MKADLKKIRPIPFDFVLEELYSVDPLTKPMFGCHAIYIKNKIVLILRRREDNAFDNGIWIATTYDHHESLRKDLPSLRAISLFGDQQSGWQNLPVTDDRFEEEVMKVCKFILKGDHRIGKIPKPRRNKNSANSKR